jgi:hypothetical protein
VPPKKNNNNNNNILVVSNFDTAEPEESIIEIVLNFFSLKKLHSCRCTVLTIEEHKESVLKMHQIKRLMPKRNIQLMLRRRRGRSPLTRFPKH